MVVIRTWAELRAWRSSAEEYGEYLWREAGIPSRYRELRLATHPLLAGPMAPVVRRMMAGPQPDPEFWQQSWYLWGNVGVGKTGLAVGYAQQWVDPAHGDPASVVYHSVPDLLGSLRASYGARAGRHGGAATGRGGEAESEAPGEWEIIRRCREADLLVLDDLGAEQSNRSGWVEDRLRLVVGWRHEQELPAVYTSNLSPGELSAQIGERLVWRIVESFGERNVIRVDGPNLRG